jgi:streptogramin lyase
VSILLLAGFVATAGAARPVFPESIPLPTGFRPEGIAAGRGAEFFVGSLVAGAIFKGDFRTGEGEILVPPQEGRVAVGLAYDARTDYLYVAGEGTGAAYVYDGTTGDEVAMIQLTDPGTFVNDVIVTRAAAYFTDSFRPFLYKVPLSKTGEPMGEEADELELTGDFDFVSEAFNANGIDATPNGEWLIVVNSTTGELYRVDPHTGVAAIIDPVEAQCREATASCSTARRSTSCRTGSSRSRSSIWPRIC